MPKINWEKVEDSQEFSPIPEGTYLANIESITVKNTQKGDEMWTVKFSIKEGEYQGKKVLTNLVFNDGGYGNIKKLYSAIFDSKLPAECEPSDIEGEEVIIDVIITEYNGKKYNNIPYAGFEAAVPF